MTDLYTLGGTTEENIVSVAASLKKPSEHPLGAAIVEEAANRNVPCARWSGLKPSTEKACAEPFRAQPIWRVTPPYWRTQRWIWAGTA